MRVLLSLGSNVGDRLANLRAALDAIGALEGVAVTAASSCYETEPVGEIEQPPFANMAAEIETDCGPLELLDAFKRIEAAFGRDQTNRAGPRPLDIDIVLWGAREVKTARLVVPHPEFRDRAFVLTPLAEIAPGAIDPVTGKTVAELARQPGLKGRVVRKL